MKIVNNLKQAIANYEKAVREAAEEIAVSELANIQANTPVKTGALRRSIGADIADDEKKTEIIWGTDIIYAAKVEYESRSYLGDTLRNDASDIEKVFAKHLGEVGD